MRSNLDDYLQALLPRSCRVLGVRLRPFSIGHALLLHAIASPFDRCARTNDRRPAGLGDLMAAVWICSHSWASGADGVRGIRFRWAIWWMWIHVWLATRFIDPQYLLLTRSAWIDEHIADGWKCPDTWIDKKSSDLHPMGTHLLHRLRIELMTRCHLTSAQALDTPVAIALQDLVAALEIDGQLRRVNDSELAAFNMARDPNVIADIKRQAEELKRARI